MSQEYPDIPAFRAALLDVITRHDGKLTWYQLDCAVVARFPHLSLQLMSVLADMEACGDIETVPNPDIPGMPFYRSRFATARPAT